MHKQAVCASNSANAAFVARADLLAVHNPDASVGKSRMTNPSVSTGANATVAQCPANPLQDAWTYWIDACQRGLLFLDVLQQRSERYREHAAKVAPHVLKFGCELIMDGRKLPRPVNYVLVRIVPPDGIEIDASKRPFVIVDPRAGHGPGIGGFKAQSEVGVALKAGSSLLLHRVPARSRARADDRGYRARGGRVPRARDRAPSASRGQARSRRQLPGRMGGHAACSHEARAFRADHPRRLTSVLLGRRSRTKPHALHGWAAGRQLAHCNDGGPRQRQVRWRVDRQQLREPQPRQHALDQTLQPLLQDRHRGAALSRVRAVVGRPRAAQRRGNAVHRR